MRGILKPLVAVELQLCGDLLLFFADCQPDGVQDQIHCLLCPSLVSHNAVVVEVTDHRQVQHSLFGMDIRNVRDPFTVRLVCVKLSIQQILILVELLPHLSPFPGAANFRQ